MIVIWAEETWYARSTSGVSKPGPVKKSRARRLVGLEQWRYMRENGATFGRACGRPLVAITKLPVFLTVTFYFINFAWVIGVNATTGVWMPQFYGFNDKDLGMHLPLQFHAALSTDASSRSVLHCWNPWLCDWRGHGPLDARRKKEDNTP